MVSKYKQIRTWETRYLTMFDIKPSIACRERFQNHGPCMDVTRPWRIQSTSVPRTAWNFQPAGWTVTTCRRCSPTISNHYQAWSGTMVWLDLKFLRSFHLCTNHRICKPLCQNLWKHKLYQGECPPWHSGSYDISRQTGISLFAIPKNPTFPRGGNLSFEIDPMDFSSIFLGSLGSPWVTPVNHPLGTLGVHQARAADSRSSCIKTFFESWIWKMILNIY